MLELETIKRANMIVDEYIDYYLPLEVEDDFKHGGYMVQNQQFYNSVMNDWLTEINVYNDNGYFVTANQLKEYYKVIDCCFKDLARIFTSIVTDSMIILIISLLKTKLLNDQRNFAELTASCKLVDGIITVIRILKAPISVSH